MIRWVVQPLAALGFAGLLLYLGQYVRTFAGFAPFDLLPAWVQIDLDYFKSLSSEIGGSGFDALVVGWIAGFVAARMNRSRDAEQQRASLRRRLRRSGTVDLAAELKTGASRLPLAGIDFTVGTVTNANLDSPRFYSHRWRDRLWGWFTTPSGPSESVLTSIIFESCEIEGARFGGSTGGAELTHCQFARCEILASDFRNAKFTNKIGAEPFIESTLSRCRFDGATFVRANMAEVEVRWCSYWGATFENSHMPAGLFDALRDAGCIEPGAGSYRVRRLSEILPAPSWKRIKFLARYWFGARFVKV